MKAVIDTVEVKFWMYYMYRPGGTFLMELMLSIRGCKEKHMEQALFIYLFIIYWFFLTAESLA